MCGHIFSSEGEKCQNFCTYLALYIIIKILVPGTTEFPAQGIDVLQNKI